MIELVHTSVPHGLLPGDGGFCTVAATKDVPVALRQRLEQLSSYKHLVSAPGPQYERGNPVAWSHLVLQTGEHLLSCVRACAFDYTNRTNRIARHWCFAPREVPAGTNFADVLLHGAAEELSTPWSGEPRWLPPRSGSPLAASTDRSDCRPVAWNALFGESRGPALAAGFAAALIHAVRDGGRGIVFRTSPAVDADGVRALGLFADLLALVPADLRSRVIFSTYPATLPAWMPRHLVCLQSGDPALAACATFVDLEMGTVSGAERLPQDPDLLHLAQHGRKQAPPPSIRPFASSSAASAPAPSAPARGRTPAAPTGRLVRAPSGRLVSKTQVKKTKPEDILIYVLCAAIVLAAVTLSWWLFKPASKNNPPQNSVTQAKPGPSTNAPSTSSAVNQPKPRHISETNTDSVPVKQQPKEATPPKLFDKPPANMETIQVPPPPDPLLSAEVILFNKEYPNAKDWENKGRKGEGFWYFYDKEGSWTNQPIRKKEGAKKGLASGSSWGNKPLNVDKLLAYSVETKEIYWNFTFKPEEGWFAKGERIDLREKYFGLTPVVFEIWKRVMEKQQGKPWNESYEISFSGIDPSESSKIVEYSARIEGRFLKMEDIVQIVDGPVLKRFEDNLQLYEAAFTRANNEKKESERKETEVKNKLRDLQNKRDRLDAELNQLEEKKRNASGKEEEGLKNQIQKKTKERNDLRTEIDQLTRTRVVENAEAASRDANDEYRRRKRAYEDEKIKKDNFVKRDSRKQELSRYKFSDVKPVR